MQVPRGQYSVLYELRNGNLTAAEAMIYLCLNHGSTWNSGATWIMSGDYLSKLLGTGMSRSYVAKNLTSLNAKGWIEKIGNANPSGSRYQIRHHLCDPEDVPVDKDDKPLKFAVPRGAGGPLERCFEGDISWKAALTWIVLKHRSNWKAHSDTAGQTESATLLELSKRCRIRLATFHKILTELTYAGMLVRLTPKSQAAVFQLFPKPFAKPVQSRASFYWKRVGGIEIKTDDEYWYSNNHQYRIHRENLDIQRRRPGGTWRRISDYERGQVIPKGILRDFDYVIEIMQRANGARGL